MKTLRWIVWGLLGVLCVGVMRLPLTAQNDVIPAEVHSLFNDISDIDKLRILNPLELTPEQIDRLIVVIKRAQDDYNRKLADAAVPPIRKIAGEIKETRRKLLTGGSVPKDLDDKVKKIQADFMEKHRQQRNVTLKGLSDAVREVLTKKQVATATSLARNFLDEEGRTSSKTTDAQYFNYYVLQTFILYPRILPLLEDMKKARSSSSE